jgi:signal peptidase II
MTKKIKFLILAAAIIIVDQLSKHYLLALVMDGSVIEVTSFFNLVMVWNRGISFGMFAGDAAHTRWVLIFIAVTISLVLAALHYRKPTEFTAIPVGMIIGGAIGNVIDRIRFGAVADFFDFHIWGYHYPAFNIADSCIFLGVVLMFISSFKKNKSD